MTHSESVPPLKRKFMRAAVLAASGGMGQQFIRFVGNLVLTRLLMPEHFGLMSVVSAFLVGVAMLSDGGIRDKLINSNSVGQRDFVNTVWTIQAVRGCAMASVVWIIAALMLVIERSGLAPTDSVYADPLLPALMTLVALTCILDGLRSPGVVLSQRELKLGKATIMQITSQLVGLSVMVAAATYARNVWALAIGGIVSALVGLILSHLWFPRVGLRFAWDGGAASQVWRYGKWVALSSGITFVAQTLDRLLLAAYFTSATMGLYSLAYFMVQASRQLVARVVSGAAVPAVSELARRKPEDLPATYHKLRRPVDVFSGLVAGGLMAGGPAVISLLYDSRYSDAGVILQLLAPIVILNRYIVIAPLMVALNRPRLFTVAPLFSAIGTLTLVPAGAYFHGEMGATVGVVVAQYLQVPVMIFIQTRFGCFRLSRELFIVVPTFVGYLAGLVFTLGLQQFYSTLPR